MSFLSPARPRSLSLSLSCPLSNSLPLSFSLSLSLPRLFYFALPRSLDLSLKKWPPSSASEIDNALRINILRPLAPRPHPVPKT